MTRIREWELSEGDREEIEADEQTRRVIRTYRRMLGRELGDEHLWDRGLVPPEDWRTDPR